MSFRKVLLKDFILPISDRLLGTSVSRKLKELQLVSKMDRVSLGELSEKKLESILSLASQKSSFYQSLGVKRESGESASDWLSRFPILTKEIIRNNPEKISVKPLQSLIKCETSGSSGEQTTIYVGKKELSLSRAYQFLWWHWAGYEMGDPIIQTGLQFQRSKLKRIKDLIFGVTYVLAFAHNPKTIQKVFSKTSRSGDQFFFGGYASSLFSIGTIIKESGLSVTNIKSIISWGDKLFPHYRELLESVFSCKVYESYGTAEELMIASMYDLDYLYTMDAHVWIEIVDDEGNAVPDGQMGHVLITSLDNRSFPLIRYRIGDLAIRLPDSERPKGAKLPFKLLKKVVGRNTDLVKTSWGETLIVHSFTGIIEFFQDIEKFQVIQKELDKITIRYIPGKDFSPDTLDKIESQINSELSQPLSIQFEKVNEILPSPSGKPQIIINETV